MIQNSASRNKNCELSTLTNKTETMALYFSKTVNAQQESVYNKLNYYNRISANYKKNLFLQMKQESHC